MKNPDYQVKLFAVAVLIVMITLGNTQFLLKEDFSKQVMGILGITDEVRRFPKQNLRQTMRLDLYPSWSPDANFLVFTSNQLGYYDIFMVDILNNRLTNLTNTSDYDESFPLWSPTGNYIAYLSNQDVNIGKSWDIWIMEIDGRNSINLTKGFNSFLIRQYSWSPDGNYIAFTSFDDNLRGDIFIVNIKEKKFINLTQNEEDEDLSFEMPTWSPDGQEIAFLGMNPEDNTRALWSAEVNDPNPSLLNIDFDFTSVSWSPTSGAIAAVVKEDSQFRVIIVNRDDANEIIITSGVSLAATTASWSLDGNFIAFGSDSVQNSDIWVMTSDGADIKNITPNSSGFDWFPVWSPEGDYIAFISDRSGETNIWIINSDGSNTINVSK